ncbi:MAG: ABC transporter substrate-binding protein, partial [Alphaproteobacteria bacterium]
MKRREFIRLVGGSVAAWPLVARAQQPAMPVIGFLHSGSLEPFAARIAAFHQGLGEAGFVEGRNVAIEYRWAHGQYDGLPALAADLVRRQVGVIAATGGAPSALAAKGATSTIPIVFVAGADPIKLGLVNNLNRPDTNITGLTAFTSELVPKRLELLHEVVQTAMTIALLVNPANAVTEIVVKDVQEAASTLGLQLRVVHASAEPDFDKVFAALGQLQARALVIGTDAFFDGMSERLASLAAHHAMPTIYQTREFAAAGGLMSYGGSLTDAYRKAGGYVGRVLRGERPADLPVMQSTKVELIINLRTAKALGV